MGAGNVASVFAHWTRLPDQPFRLLVFMAHTSLDPPGLPDQPARRYWGGRDALARAIGRDVPPLPDPADLSETAARARRDRTNAYAAVKAALKVLGDRSAVTRLRDGRADVRSEYKLNLGIPLRAEGSSRPTPLGLGHPTPEGVHHSGPGVESPHPERSTHSPPKEDRGGPGTPGEDASPPSLVSPTREQQRCDDHHQVLPCTGCAADALVHRGAA